MLLNKKITGNIIWLGLLQLANYVFPFLSIPYLSRILSTEHYGLILFSVSFTAYFMILCDYGFNLSATKQIAVNSNNQLKLNQIVSAVTVIKLLLLVVAVVVNLGVVLSFAKFRDYWFIYMLNLVTLLNNVFFPVWFFQGIEKMRYITLIQVSIKGLTLLAIFMVIHQDSQYYYWPICNAVGAILGALFAQYVLMKKFALKYQMPRLSDLLFQLKDGWHIFISTLAISLFTVSNSFFLGILTNTTLVAFYASAEKIMNAVQGLLATVSQAIFPHITKTVSQNPAQGIKQLQKALFIQGTFGLVVSVSLFMLAPLIVEVLLGNKYLVATTSILRILSILPFIICLSNILGIQTMLAFGLNKPFSRILLISSVINLGLIFMLVPHFSYVGSAISVVITESLVTLMMMYYLSKSGIIVWFGELR